MPLGSQCLWYLNRAGLRCWQTCHRCLRTSSSSFGCSSKSHTLLGRAIHCSVSYSILTGFDRSLRRRRRSTSWSTTSLPSPSSLSRLATTAGAYSEDETASFSTTIAASSTKAPFPSSYLDTFSASRGDHNSLWHQKLAAAQRQGGNKGVLRFWATVAKNQTLIEMEGSEADYFWNTILDAALADDIHLESVYVYARWLLDNYATSWPNLYWRIITFTLDRKDFQRAFRWHMRLISEFDPGASAFGSLLNNYILDSDVEQQYLLQSLYMTSRHHCLYDVLIPRLFECGLSTLCITWRDFLLRFRDLPKPCPASQPFLQFLGGYYSNKSLVLEEQVVEGLASVTNHTRKTTADWVASANDHHGIIQRKSRGYNDYLGARWLASSWIPLDFAIHTLQGLGVGDIGPLSLQAIALRDSSIGAITSRLEQLDNLGIRIGQSNYSKALRYFAESKNEELLATLLQCDIHPEVFDDFDTQRRILETATVNGDWGLSQLLLAIQPAVSQHTIHATSNQLVQTHVLNNEIRRATSLVDDMRAMGVDVTSSTIEVIHEYLLTVVPWDMPHESRSSHQLAEAIALANRTALLGKLPPSKAWRNILYNLGKFGRFGTMEQLAIGIIDGFNNQTRKDGGLVSVHRSDSPVIGQSTYLRSVPLDLPIAHDWHPIQRIFTHQSFQSAIIRWGFQKGLSRRHIDPSSIEVSAARPADFEVARGVRLLKELSRRGIPINKQFVRAEVLRCLGMSMVVNNKRKGKQTLSDVWPALAEHGKLFNMAFEDDLLPKPIELRDELMDLLRQRLTQAELDERIISSQL